MLKVLASNCSDRIQIQKDIPRTSRWLVGSPGAPSLTEDQVEPCLSILERVLHAFLSKVRLQMHGNSASEDTIAGFYMQGMNGIAFILIREMLETKTCSKVEPVELLVFQIFTGLIQYVLPQVFGNYSVRYSIHTNTEAELRGSDDGFNQCDDYSDLFTSLIDVGSVLQEIVEVQLPTLYRVLERSGMVPSLLAYKWFPTLFSDISLTAHHSQLQYETLLTVWDICFLLGTEGIFLVSLALFSIAESALIECLEEEHTSQDCRTRPGYATDNVERLSFVFLNILCKIQPSDLITSVCEILELCVHPVLLRLRNGHRRHLCIFTKSSRDLRASQLHAD